VGEVIMFPDTNAREIRQHAWVNMEKMSDIVNKNPPAGVTFLHLLRWVASDRSVSVDKNILGFIGSARGKTMRTIGNHIRFLQEYGALTKVRNGKYLVSPEILTDSMDEHAGGKERKA
jgi:hypothetical protein